MMADDCAPVGFNRCVAAAIIELGDNIRELTYN